MAAGKLDIAKKQHRERGQLASRKKLGLLEKHKDYVKRARDYHSKQNRLKVLRSKAAERNKDEFYFGMHSSRTEKGVHLQSSNNEALPAEVVKLLKSQDAKYIQQKRAKEQKNIERLKLEIASMSPATPSSSKNHIVFTEDLSDVTSKKPSALIRRLNKRKASGSPDPVDRSGLEAELEARQKRAFNLARVQRDMEVQKLLMSKGSRREIVRTRKPDDVMDEATRLGLDEDQPTKKKPPKPEVGLRTGARVFKWNNVRKR